MCKLKNLGKPNMEKQLRSRYLRNYPSGSLFKIVRTYTSKEDYSQIKHDIYGVLNNFSRNVVSFLIFSPRAIPKISSCFQLWEISFDEASLPIETYFYPIKVEDLPSAFENFFTDYTLLTHNFPVVRKIARHFLMNKN